MDGNNSVNVALAKTQLFDVLELLERLGKTNCGTVGATVSIVNVRLLEAYAQLDELSHDWTFQRYAPWGMPLTLMRKGELLDNVEALELFAAHEPLKLE